MLGILLSIALAIVILVVIWFFMNRAGVPKDVSNMVMIVLAVIVILAVVAMVAGYIPQPF